MIVRDFEETAEVSSPSELEAFLTRRFNKDGIQVNSFWMCHTNDYPAMSLLVRGELATLGYLGGEGEGFAAMGTDSSFNNGGTTLFYFDRQIQPVVNYQIITITEAVRAAKEFLQATALPSSIKWENL